MKYRRRRGLLFKQKHLRTIIGIAIALVVIATIFIIVSLTGKEAKKQASVNAVASKGVINIGLRDNLLNLCTYNQETGVYEGFEPDVAAEIVRRLFGDDIIVNYIAVNTETRQAYLQRGEIDIALGAAVNIKESGVTYSVPYFSEGSAFLVMEDKISGIRQLSGGTIAITQDSMHAQKSDKEEKETLMAEYLKVLEIEAGVKIYASYPEAVVALRSGHVDAVCASETNLKLHGITGMLILPERFMPSQYRVAIRTALNPFSDAVNDVIAQMRADGTLTALAQKWNLISFEQLEEQ